MIKTEGNTYIIDISKDANEYASLLYRAIKPLGNVQVIIFGTDHDAGLPMSGTEAICVMSDNTHLYSGLPYMVSGKSQAQIVDRRIAAIKDLIENILFIHVMQAHKLKVKRLQEKS